MRICQFEFLRLRFGEDDGAGAAPAAPPPPTKTKAKPSFGGVAAMFGDVTFGSLVPFLKGLRMKTLNHLHR